MDPLTIEGLIRKICEEGSMVYGVTITPIGNHIYSSMVGEDNLEIDGYMTDGHDTVPESLKALLVLRDEWIKNGRKKSSE